MSHTEMATHVPQTAPAVKRFTEVLDMLMSLRAAKMATRTLSYRDLLIKTDKAPAEFRRALPAHGTASGAGGGGADMPPTGPQPYSLGVGPPLGLRVLKAAPSNRRVR